MKNKLTKTLIIAGFLTVAATSADARNYRWDNYEYNYVKPTTENSSSRNIASIQESLWELGYFVGHKGVTGKMDAATKRAIKQFQADSGLNVDGVVGYETASMINGSLGGGFTQVSARNSGYSDNTASIQATLGQLGYFVGQQGANGIMNSPTRDAVKRFQADNGLQAHGMVDVPTAKLLSAHVSQSQQIIYQPVSNRTYLYGATSNGIRRVNYSY